MRRAAILILVVVVLSVGWVLGWEYVRPETPTGTPDWYGKVTAVFPAGKDDPGWVTITLVPHPSAPSQPADPNRATFKDVRADFAKDTPIRQRKNKDRGAALQPGQTVSVWCNGPITNRHPPTRPAGFIVIED